MKEERFEKVVEWDFREGKQHWLSGYIIFTLFNSILPIVIGSFFPQYDDTFFPLGIFIIIQLIISFIFVRCLFESKVYWRKIQ